MISIDDVKKTNINMRALQHRCVDLSRGGQTGSMYLAIGEIAKAVADLADAVIELKGGDAAK